MPDPVVTSQSSIQAIINKLKAGMTKWNDLSADIRIQIEHTPQPGGGYWSESDFGGGGGSTSGGGPPSFVFDPAAAATLDPVLQDAATIYYRLYGVSPPTGLLQSLVKQYGNIFAIENVLFGQAKADKAPGYADYQSPIGSGLGTGGGGGAVNPTVSAAEAYYFQLYGKQAPKGMLEKLVQQGMDLYAIQNQLLQQGKNAPGYDAIRYANLLANGNSLYFRLWGEDPPPEAVKGLVDKGLNLFQMEHQWRADPTFQNTRTYRDELAQRGATLAQALGAR